MSFIKIQKIDPITIANPDPGHIYVGQDLTNSGFTGFWQKDEWGNIYYIGGSGATYITYNVTGTTYIVSGSTSSGTSGDGTSGTSGNDGTSGTSGKTGVSGTSGTNGTSGSSGLGSSGTSGTGGTSGKSGTSGSSGFGSSGTSGYGSAGSSGSDGSSGSSGRDGAYGGATRRWILDLLNPTPITGGMYISASVNQLDFFEYVRLHRVDADGDLLDGWLSTWTNGILKIESRFDLSVVGLYLIHSGTTVQKISINIYEISGVTSLSAYGNLTDGEYLVSYVGYGNGSAGTSGVNGAFLGSSGTSGKDGLGTSGKDGTSGTSGSSTSGTSGNSTSGTSGIGTSGTSGIGTSGTSGLGTSGTSGIGTSGSSGSSGKDGNEGFITDNDYYYDVDADRLYVNGITILTGLTYTGTGYSGNGNILTTDGTGKASWVSTSSLGIQLWSGNTSANIWNLNIGNVGINTTSPSYLLDLYKVGNTGIRLQSTTFSGIYFSDNDPTYANINTQNDGTLRFGVNTGIFDTGSTQLVLNSNGFIGIGVTNPGQKLVVSGGTIQIVDGNQGNGKVLTSDSNGVGSWQTATSGGLSRWINVTGVTSSDTGIIYTSSDTTPLVKVGYPLKYTISGIDYFGIVTGATSSLITVDGVNCSGLTNSSVYVGTPEMIWTESFLISGAYSDSGDTTLLADDLNTYYRWQTSSSYCVKFSVIHKVNAGTTNPKVNVMIDGNEVSTLNTNSGLTVSTSWNSTGIDINSSNYKLSYLSSVEIKTSASIGDNAKDLTLQMVCVKA